MEKSKILNILDFYLDSMDDDIELIDAELENANINVEESEKRIMELLKNAKAELKIEKGRELKTNFEKAKKEVEEDGASNVALGDEFDFRLAARNIGDLSEDDKKVISKNLRILDKLNGEKTIRK
ncbi:MAG: hypothetical protein COW71_06590 [Ignavibacteriales bacterium CG18_big_fil_WC_8_21_14_2_50_31_20]|nr:MAG: hypothetical protein COW71_06590 [Ignavibacteriales bacterium CG18_big_fil_WC_8_21_14_2_50_31_20]